MTEIKAKPGDYVRIGLAKKELEGTIIESYDKNIILIKLNSGYNIGVPKENIQGIEIIKKFLPQKEEFKIPASKSKPSIGMIITGGTIASKVDYKTGGVKAITSVSEFAKFYPKLFEKVNVKKIESPFMKLSEDMNQEDWQKISEIAVEMLSDEEIQGIIVTHGSDTLHYTASALSFSLRNLNKPVVLTFSQRSIDRASSDAELNLECAAEFALSDCAEVVIIGHANESDDYCHAIRATKARKMHTSARDTFQPINSKPIARVFPDKVEFLEQRRPRNKQKTILDSQFSTKVAVVKFYPGQNPDILNYYKENSYKGIIIEMTGLGHTSENFLPRIKDLVKSGVTICAVAQTINGRLNPKVYSRGRELEKAGAIFLEDMLSETAFVKLSWVLGHRQWRTPEKIKEKMLENFEGEFSDLLTK